MNIESIPPQVIEKWRSEFEALEARNYDDPPESVFMRADYAPDEYEHSNIENMWQGFLLARSTVEICIRDNQDDNCHDSSIHHFNRGLMAAIDDIRVDGYRVVGEK